MGDLNVCRIIDREPWLRFDGVGPLVSEGSDEDHQMYHVAMRNSYLIP